MEFLNIRKFTENLRCWLKLSKIFKGFRSSKSSHPKILQADPFLLENSNGERSEGKHKQSKTNIENAEKQEGQQKAKRTRNQKSFGAYKVVLT